MPAELAELIERHAEGNPFYAEELVGMLLDQGVISSESGNDSGKDSGKDSDGRSEGNGNGINDNGSGWRFRRLRLLALAGNAAFIAYGSMAQLLPVLVLHLALVPVNLWRLNQAFQRKPAAPHAKATHAQTAARRRSGWTPTPRGARVSRRVRRGGDPSSATGPETGTAATAVRRHGAPCQA